MPQRLDIILHSDFPQESCLLRIAEESDVDQFTLFSRSGYKGTRPIVGRINGSEFRLHKRRYWHNSFGRVLFGRVIAEGRGVTIEGYWDVWRSTRVLIRTWLVLVDINWHADLFQLAARRRSYETNHAG